VPPRIYEAIPELPTFPYVTLGETQEIDDSVQCLDGSELFADFHIWSSKLDFSEVKQIASRMKRLIHLQDLTLSEQRCVLIEHRVTRMFRDADSITKHGVVTFRALTELTDP